MHPKDIRRIAVAIALLAGIGYHAAPHQAHAHGPPPSPPAVIDGTGRQVALTAKPALEIGDAERRHWTLGLAAEQDVAQRDFQPDRFTPAIRRRSWRDPAVQVVRPTCSA